METLKKSKVRGKADKRSEIIAQYLKLQISNGKVDALFKKKRILDYFIEYLKFKILYDHF